MLAVLIAKTLSYRGRTVRIVLVGVQRAENTFMLS